MDEVWEPVIGFFLNFKWKSAHSGAFSYSLSIFIVVIFHNIFQLVNYTAFGKKFLSYAACMQQRYGNDWQCLIDWLVDCRRWLVACKTVRRCYCSARRYCSRHTTRCLAATTKIAGTSSVPSSSAVLSAEHSSSFETHRRDFVISLNPLYRHFHTEQSVWCMSVCVCVCDNFWTKRHLTLCLTKFRISGTAADKWPC